MPHATTEECPCCFNDLARGGEHVDSALIVAFISGVMAGKSNVPIEEALCHKHTTMAAVCLTEVCGGQVVFGRSPSSARSS